MNDLKLMSIDIEPRSNPSGPVKPAWSRSDNSFQFNFLTETSSSPPGKPPPSIRTEPSSSSSSSLPSSSAVGVGFAFDFQIPPRVPEEMETGGGADASSPDRRAPPSPEPNAASAAPSKTKKKKKGGKKKPSDTEKQQQAGEEEDVREEPSAEELLNRQLDWCVEQLEQRLGSQRGSSKQKEEASRALKTLRSSKAPLVKKRQVMRAMTGDYRKQMEDEKTRQFKLIQSEVASAQVKVVSETPKKSVFHRKAEIKPQSAAAAEENPTGTAGQNQDETTAFVFVPSKQEFLFNFL